MELERTTLRLEKRLKLQAQREALEEGTTLQAIHNKALDRYFRDKAKNKAKKIVFHTHDMGAQLDNLTRDDFYDDPKVS